MLTVKRFTFNPVQENTYVVYSNKGECAIIDPGCYFPAERDELKAFIDENRLIPKYLLNTHCHLDHVFGNKWVNDTWGLELFTHPGEKVVLDFAPASGKAWGLPFDNYTGPLHPLVAGDEVKLGDDFLKVLFMPGHSPAHIGFYNEAGGFIVSGDVLFRLSIGRTDLPGGDYEQLIASIREQLMTLPDDTIVYCGHGDDTTVGAERKENPFLKGVS
ncbi:MAG: MBL fold metallo-hydrolase [Chitinophagaceae bacterium]|nr:MAG: MBL fold metallo-hydrolase [Chitinophagaceae bacterium]